MKAFIFGIDGASYGLLNKLVDEGKMPNFKRLIQGGIYCKLNSVVPPHTAPGWMSAFTGVNPGKHGIYQFWDTQSDSYVGKFMGSVDLGVQPLWQILNAYGYKTGVLNIPMSHPPSKLNGFMITWPLSNTLRYSYPEDLLMKIAQVGGHYANDLTTMCDGRADYIDRAIQITKKRVKTVQYLLKNYEWDFFSVVFTEIDRVSHFYWHYMDEKSPEYCPDAENKLKTAVEDIYLETDRALEAILKYLPEDVMVIVLSDHGFGTGYMNFYVQSYLMDIGALHVYSIKGELPEQKDRSFSEINSNSWLEFSDNNMKYSVDWSKTKAYMAAPGSYGVNINLKGRQTYGIVDKDDYERTRDILIEQLYRVENPKTGSRLFKRIAKREEIYYGSRTNGAPDIILIPESYGIMVHHAIVPGQYFGNPEQKGMHRNDGVLIIHGRNIQGSDRVKNAHIEDITPTILDYYNIAIPAYMDGKPLCSFGHECRKQDNLCEHLESQEARVCSEDSYEADELDDIKDRLKALGYL
ncbi:MAG: alkaline phosphatase family protein [Caulobacteraceae bacterium]